MQKKRERIHLEGSFLLTGKKEFPSAFKKDGIVVCHPVKRFVPPFSRLKN
jgi:hypothetical protein